MARGPGFELAEKIYVKVPINREVIKSNQYQNNFVIYTKTNRLSTFASLSDSRFAGNLRRFLRCVAICREYASAGVIYALLTHGPANCVYGIEIVPDEPTVPGVIEEINDRTMSSNDPDATIDLRNYFEITNVTGQIVRFEMNAGRNVDSNFIDDILIELFDANTPYDRPQTVANFLNYVNDGDYDSVYIHRSPPNFVVQGGGFAFSNLGVHIPTDAPVQNEPGISNTRGTIAMAKVGGDPDSATSEWFFNVVDNSGGNASLDTQNGGFTVFGRAIGSSMNLIDGINDLPTRTVNPALGAPFFIDADSLVNLIVILDANTIDVYPDENEDPSVLTFEATSSNDALVDVSVNGSELNMSFPSGQNGEAVITVTATDLHGNDAVDVFRVILKTAQTINFSLIPEITLGDPPITLNATASSNLAVGYRIVSGPAIVNGNIFTPTRVGSVTVEAFQNGNDSFNAAIPVQQVIQIVSNFHRWVNAFYPNPVDQNDPAVSGDGVDMTGDGISNLLAYAFNLDPRIFHRDLLPAPNFDEANRLTIDFIRDTRATDLNYRVEAGPAPNFLQTIAQSIGGSAPSGSGVISESGGSTTRTVTVSDTVTAEQSQIRLMRLVVTRD